MTTGDSIKHGPASPQPQKFLGMTVSFNPAVPENEIWFSDGKSLAKIVNLAPEHGNAGQHARKI